MLGILILLAIFVGAAFVAGRNYERKQFVKIGSRKSELQKILGVFNDNGR